MKFGGFEQNSCEHVQHYLDSYLNDELLVETNFETQKHLQDCRGCAEELEARRNVRDALRRAVRAEEAPAALRMKVREGIRTSGHGGLFSVTRERAAIAALLVVALSLSAWGIFAVRKGGRNAEATLTATMNPTLPEQTRRALSIGLGDHVHCAVEDSSTKTFFGELRPAFVGLLPMVKEKLDNNYELTAAHHCEIDGREFAHLIWRKGDKILSVIFTNKNGEAFAPDDHEATGGVPLFGGRTRDYAVAGFEVGDHFAFAASNLLPEENARIASNIAPEVRSLLAQSESIAVSRVTD